jgi:hypothetical protein
MTDDPEDVVSFDTLDEAIAYAIADLEPGGTLTIHADNCESEDGEDNCTCEPLVLTTGASA